VNRAYGPWTGGIANREYRRGKRAEPPPSDALAVLALVRGYQADCARWKHLLRASDHPTAEGTVRMIYCRDDQQKDLVRRAFQYATARGGS
jgi:hypothetical protein